MMHPIPPLSLLAQSSGPDNFMWIGLILMIGVFYFVMLSGSRKDKKRRQEMLNNVKKSDRVMTIGGILGSVVNVTENEVTLKVDESANVKITVIRSAIQKVLTEGEKPTTLQ
jgi:preprotein translocase subunit YajC